MPVSCRAAADGWQPATDATSDLRVRRMSREYRCCQLPLPLQPQRLWIVNSLLSRFGFTFSLCILTASWFVCEGTSR